MRRPAWWVLGLLSGVISCGGQVDEGATPRLDAAGVPIVHPNDNRRAAGKLRRDTLRVTLVARMASWRPQADSGPAVTVAAFAEGERAPEIPAPLIRVPAGTVIDATVRNDLRDSTLRLIGFVTHPAAGGDTVTVAPGDSVRLIFAAGQPGTYLYSGAVGGYALEGAGEQEQLGGAFVVDEPGARPDDRVFVINIWGQVRDSSYPNVLAINGRSFPWTERLQTTMGDSLRWRWVNASQRSHPMHLHGFYFRVDARGGPAADTALMPDARRLAVTEQMMPFTTLRLAWSPDRPGNWLFHCHLGFHVLPENRLDWTAASAHDHTSSDVGRHMSGLLLGISVAPARGWIPDTAGTVDRLTLVVQEGRPRGRAPRAMGFVLQSGAPPAPDSVDIPGRPLILHRGRPAEITVVNRLAEPTGVHWHGLELESYNDGVAGWSGTGSSVAPAVAPGASFTARLLTPRAGTFIYHTHLNDLEQLTSGLYGALLVLEPDQVFDPATDHVLVTGWDGPGEPPQFVLNGDSLPPTLTLRADTAHRFRLVNIGMAGRMAWTLHRGEETLPWRRIAKDGADLPPAQVTWDATPAVVAVGETLDLSWEPPGAGRYELRAGPPGGPVRIRQAIVVR